MVRLPLDLAPENIAAVEARSRREGYAGNLQARVGSIFELPFADATFDCVWCANVMQYQTETGAGRAIKEFARVLKPGGTLALKDTDYEHVEMVPLNRDLWDRFVALHKQYYLSQGVLSPWGCGTSLSSRLRRAGLSDIRRKAWLVERWAPLPPATRLFYQQWLTFLAGRAATYNGLPPSDIEMWQQYGADGGNLLDDPDCCVREFFVVAVGRTS
jgi:SAM-dependent methyltransferase